MNKRYRVVWNESTRTFVAVSEIASAHGHAHSVCAAAVHGLRTGLKALVAALAAAGLVHAAPPLATQLPTGGQVVAGQAAITQTGNAVLSVNQSSNAAVIDWNTFNLGSAATVHFLQPSSSAAVLNRVLDANPSQIYGRITAPGQVFFTNPSGMYFAPSASIDVGSLTATTHSIGTADFMAGRYRFTREGATGAIVNEGQIQAALGGYVALLAPEVRNHGVVLAQMGAVALAAGEAYQLQIQGSRLSGIDVTPATIATLVENGQAVLAPGGWIVLSAKAAQQLEASVVNTGQLAANSLVERGGRIVLESTASVTSSGSISANSEQGPGGQVTLTAPSIVLGSRSRIEAQGATAGGTVLVGGDWQGRGDLPQATTVTMQEGASIDASATHSGDGGTVVLWSDIHNPQGHTTARGSITARGGAQGGNGGQVETSGYRLDVDGATVNAGADQGQGGQWLLDPYNITIAGSGASGTAYSANYTPSATSTILASSIKASLDAGTSVTISTGAWGSAGADAGNITVNSAIAKTAGAAATLTLTAAYNITIGADITSTSGALTLSLNSGAALTGTGTLNTNGGTLTINAGADSAYRGAIGGTGGLVKQGAGGLFLMQGATVNAVNAGSYTSSAQATSSINTSTSNLLIFSNANWFETRSSSGGTPFVIPTANAVKGQTFMVYSDAGFGVEISKAGTSMANNLVWGGYPQQAAVFTYDGSQWSYRGSPFMGSTSVGNSNTNNSNYSGSTTVQAGKLELLGSNLSRLALNGGGALSVSSGATFNLTSSTATPVSKAVGDLSGAGSINFLGADGTLGVNQTANTNFSGVIAGEGALSKSGAGTLTLSGANTFTGGITVNAGTLTLSNTIANNASNAITVNNTGTLNFNRQDTFGNAFVAVSTPITINAGGTVTNGGNYFNRLGPLTLNGGTLTSTGGATAGTLDGPFAWALGSSVTVNGGATTSTISGSNVMLGSGSSVTGATVTVNDGAATTDLLVSTKLVNSSGDTWGTPQTSTLSKAGAGTMVLSGANSYSGTTSISGGTLQIGNAGTTGTLGTGAVNIASGATLAYNRSDNLSVGPTVTGSGSITKLGSNNLSWTGAFASGSFNGAININGGTFTTLPTPNSFTLYDSTININNGSTLAIGVGSQNLTWLFRTTINFDSAGGGRVLLSPGVNFAHTSVTYKTNGGAMNRITASSGSPSLNVDPTDPVAITFDIAAGSGSAGLWVDQPFWNTGNIVKTGGGVLQLSGNKGSPQYGTTTVNGGTLVLGDGTTSNGEFGTGNVTLAAGTLLKFNRTGTGSAIANVITGAGRIEQASTGTTILTGANNYAGSTTISAGNLVLRRDAPTTGSSGFFGPGTLTIEPAGTSFSSAFSTSGWSFDSSLGGLTLGKAGNTSNITVANAASIAGPVTIYGADIAINAALTATGTSTITLAGSGNVSDGASGSVTASNVLLQGGNVTLDSASNAIGTLAASGVSGLTVVNSSALTLGSVGSTNGVSASGLVNISTRSGNLTIAQALSTTNTSASALTLNAGSTAAALTAAGGDLIVSGSGAVSVGAGGTATLYTGSVTGSTGLTTLVGSGSGRFRYGSDESTSNYTLALSSGLNAIYRGQPTITRVVNNQTITYGNALTNSFSITGGSNGDTFALAFGAAAAPTVSVSGTLSTAGYYTAGTPHTLSATGGATASQLGYAVATSTTAGTLTVNQRTLTATYAGVNKTYDATTTASVTASDNRLGADVLTVNRTATFVNKTVGTGKTVNVSGASLSGTDAANYTLASTTGSTTANITARAITISGITASNKTYDRTTSATVSTAGASGWLAGDTVTVTSTGVFADKNVGTGKTVTLSSTYGGADAGNYSITNQASTTANITARAITISGITASNKTYDGTTSATVSTAGASGWLAGDTVTVTSTGVFADKNVGTGKAVTLSSTYSGADAGNYSITNQASTTANITARTLTLTYTGVNKTYDGTTTATVTTSDNRVGGDVLAIGNTATFANKNVGTGKTVSVSGASISGTDAANYILASTTGSTTANITARTLTLTYTGVNKTYDGTNTATVTASDNRVGGDVLAIGNTATFDNKNVGTGKTVSVSGASISGTDAANYTLASTTGSTTANITTRAITISGITASNKTYDGTTSATVSTAGASGWLAGDTVTVTSTGVFADKNVGTGKTVTLTSSYGGADAGNYSITNQASTTANITQAALTIGAANASKTYNGQAYTGGNGVSYSGFVNGETSSVLGGALTYTGNSQGAVNAGTYAITPGGLSSTNYAITFANGTLTVAQAPLSITANAASKTYDGQTYSGGNGVVYSGFVNGETSAVLGGTLGYSGSSQGAKNAGTYAITPQGQTSGNYAITFNSGTLTVDRKLLTLSASKTYDGSTGLSGAVNFGGLASGETLGYTGATASDAHVATAGKYITALTLADGTGGGLASNYQLPTLNLANAPVTITARALTVSGTITGSTTKTYDGNTATTGVSLSTTFSGQVAGDSFTLTGLSLAYNSARVLDASSISASGTASFTIASTSSGSVSSDYSFTAPTIASVSASITARALSATASISGARSKTYDGTTAATGAIVGGSVTGAIAGDTVSFDGSGLSLSYNSARVVGASSIGASGSAGFAIASSTNGSVASDYSFMAPSIASVAASITAKALSATASITGTTSKTYDGTTAASGASVTGSVTGAISGDTITLSTGGLTLAYNDAHVAGASSIGASGSAGFAIAATGASSVASDYSFTAPTIASVAGGITPAALTATLANTGVSKTYDGSTAAPGTFSPSWSFAGLVSGDTGASLSSTGSAYNSANVVGASTLTVSGLALTGITGSRSSVAGDYVLSATSASVAATITPKSVSVTGLAVSDKTYDGTTAASVTSWGSVSTGVGSQTLTVTGAAANFASANVSLSGTTPQAQTVTATGYTLTDGTGLASNYQLTATSATTTATITPAALTVRANSDAKFVTLGDAAGYAGVSYSGFVNGETDSVLGGSLSISRSNSTNDTAGSYSGVLVPSGLSSNNYSISYAAGDYTIVPANQLLVTVSNVSTVYGTAASYSVASAQYLGSNNQVVTLSGVSVGANNQVTVNDGAGAQASFTLAPQGGATSGANLLRVGSYQLGITGAVTENSQNFSNTITVVGSHAVTPKSLNASVTGGLSKTYDASMAMSGLTLGLSSVQSGDAVTVAGSGAYAGKNVGTGLNYTVSNLALSGADAANYVLSSDSVSGSNGAITAKALTLSATKTYDGGTSLTGAVTLAGLVGSETLSYTGAVASNAHVAATGKYISAITLADGSNGGLAANYALPTLNAANAPVTITAKALTASAAITGASSKTYDGTTAATGASVSGSVTGAVAGDTLALNTSGVSLAYNSARVAGASSIVATGSVGLVISSTSNGSELSDYSFSAPTIAARSASITARALTATSSITGTSSKTYDGSDAATGASLNTSFSGQIAGDSITLTGLSLAYNSARVASANRIGASGTAGFAIGSSTSGSVVSDYSFTAPTITAVSASITAKALTATSSITGTTSKVYDGSDAATGASLSTSFSGQIAGDSVALTGVSLAYNSARAASASSIAASGAPGFSITSSASGSLSSDYSFTAPTIAAVNASISARALTATAGITGTVIKTYDGTTAATGASVSGSVLGALSGDSVTLSTSGVSLVYNSARVASASSIAASGSAGFTIASSSHGSVASDYSFTSPTIASVAGTITARALSASASIGGALSKTYDGTASASGASVNTSFSGQIAGDNLTLTGVTLAYNSAHVATASTISASGTPGFAIAASASGSQSSDYSFNVPSIADVSASITPKALSATASITGTTSKTYDGTTAATGAAVSGSVTGAIAGDTLSLNTGSLSLAYNSAHVLGASSIGASGSAGFVIVGTSNASVASDYSFSVPSIAAVSATITPKALSATASIVGTTSKTYDGSAAATGASLNTAFSGQLAGDSFTLTGLSLVYNSARVLSASTIGASGTAGYAVAGSASGSQASDYSFTAPTIASVAGSITAKALGMAASITGTTTKVYDGTTAATGASLSGSVTGAISGDTVNLNTSGLSLAYNSARVLDASSIGVSGTASFTIASTSSGSVASDYSFSASSIAAVSGSITARALTATASITGTTSKTYDGTTSASAAGLSTSFSGQIAGDSLTLTGLSLSYNSARVVGASSIGASGSAGFAIASSTNGSVASDYSFMAPSIASVAASITAKALSATASITGTTSKTYDGTTAASGASVTGSVTGAISGDTITLSTGGLTLAYNDAHVAGASSIGASGSAGFAIAATGASSVASDYSFTAPTIASVAGGITPAALTATLANTGVSKTYDGSTAAPGTFSPSWSFAGLVSGDTGASLSSTGSAYNSANVVGASTLTVSGLALTGITGSRSSVAGDYVLSATSASVAATITPKSVSVTGLAVSDKTYDGTTAASVTSWGSVSTGVGSQTLTVTGAAANFASANVSLSGTTPQAQTVTATGYTLTDGTGLASNYQLTATNATTTATITPAALTVRANSDAKFVTLGDAAGYAGVSYSGFVNGETDSVLGGSLSISRSNSTNDTAGSYSGVLVPSGLSSNNYSISYAAGDYTIVPANQLLVTVSNVSTVYGTAASYSVASAQYLGSNNQVVTLSGVSVGANNQVTVNDGAGAQASFTLAPQGGATSGANLLRVGSYQLGITGAVTENSQNFSNTITVVGSHAVTPKSLNASVTGGLSKTYDASMAMSGLTLGLSSVQSGDAVTVAGSGAYAGKNVGTGLNYTVSNLALSGADAANYVLSSDSVSGSNGAITAKALTLSATKTYDGGTSLTGAVTLAGLVGSETLSYTGAVASNAHVAATGKYISAITLADGSNGGLAANYALPTLNAANAPVTITAKALTASAAITGASSKTYDGTTAATGASVSGSVTGAVAGDTLALNTSGVSLAYNSARVAGASSIVATGSVGLVISSTSNGSELSDYSFSAPTIASALAQITPATLTATLANTGVSKTYDGSTAAPSGFAPSWSLAGLVAGDSGATLANTGIVYNSANVASASTLTVSGLSIAGVTGSRNSASSDYVLAASSADVGASITPKTVAVTGLAASGKTYDGSTAATITQWGSVSTGVGSETLTLNRGSAAFDSANAGSRTVTASGYSLADGSNGGLAGNYQLASTSATASAVIGQKTLTLSASKTYDGSHSLTGAVSLGGLVGSETLGYSGATASDVHVASAGKYIDAITLTDGGNGGLAANYALPTLNAANAPVTITAKALTASAAITGASSKTYDGSTAATGASVSGSVTGAVAGDTIGLDTSGVSLAYNSARVAGASRIGATGNVGFSIANSASGSLASDYSFTAPSIATISAGITPKALTANASIGGTLSKTYDGSTSASGASVSGTLSGAVGSDSLVLDVSGLSLAYNSARVASASRIEASGNAGFGIVSSALGSQSSDYSLTQPTIAAASANITPRTLYASLSNAGVTKTYDGSTAAPVNFAPSWNVVGLLAGDTGASLSYAAAAYNSKNVTQATQVVVTVSGQAITAIQGGLGSAASDYALSSSSASVTASITPKVLTITGLQVADKTYDGSTRTTVTDWGSVSTGVGSETLLLNHGLALFDSANAGSRTATARGYSLVNGGNGGLASNYQLASTSASTTATIHKALLTVTTNSDAKFVTTSDAAGYAGVSYSGFVNGESSAALSTAPTVSRSNSSVNTAGSYSGVLTAAGGAAANYDFAYNSGDYTIVPANQLLVRVNNLSSTYGTAASYTLASASYFDAGAQQVITLSDSTVSTGNLVTVNDGAGGRATFTLAPRGASLSGAQQLRVGSYLLGTAGTVTENSQNFNNTITVVGTQTVTPKALAVSTTAGVSKTYDGTTTMNGVSFALAGATGGSGVLANDLVSVSGNGDYASRNAGTQLSYTVNNLSLSGADAGNYVIAAGNSFTGGNGTITPRALTLSALTDSKTFDGNVSSARTPLSSALVAGDRITGLTQAFDSSAVGLRTLNVSGYTLDDGNGGNNYAVTLVPASGTINALQIPPVPPLTPPGGGPGGRPNGPGDRPNGPGDRPNGPGDLDDSGLGGSGSGSQSGGAAEGRSGAGQAASASPQAQRMQEVQVRVLTVQSASREQAGVVRVYVPRDVLGTEVGFSFALALPTAPDELALATLRDGAALPEWLSFDPKAMRFTARKVPANGLPLLVRVQLGALLIEVDLFESAQP